MARYPRSDGSDPRTFSDGETRIEGHEEVPASHFLQAGENLGRHEASVAKAVFATNVWSPAGQGRRRRAGPAA